MSTPIRRLWHWGPISVLGIIKLITWMTIHNLSMWWPPWHTIGATINAGLFLMLAGCTLYYFLNSLAEGPGYVPLGWKPEKEGDMDYLQYCSVCNGYKAPRSHHCRKCGRCVKKMDHHCPWINACVGWANHRYFTLFLMFGVLGCFQASVILSICMYHAINRVWYIHYGTGQEPMIYLTLSTLLLSLFAIGMAVGVVLAVGMLLYFQIRSILRNQTTIEDWILEKASSRRQEDGLQPFEYPYDLGWRQNFDFVMFPQKCDGLKWPIRDGCGEYDLTVEQIEQKQDKRLRSRVYSIVHAYSGRWVPVCAWPRAALAAPCSDEPRIPLRPGDAVRVTRWRKHWLFGEQLGESSGDDQDKGDNAVRGKRGWFPRATSVLVHEFHKAKPD